MILAHGNTRVNNLNMRCSTFLLPASRLVDGVLAWRLNRSGRLPDVIARKQFRPGPQVAAYVPQALYIEMGFAIGFPASANIIHARQGAASTLIAPPSGPSGN
jgi:hypothetical protein